MTPQQIMDMPHYGMAEQQLRKQGDWRLDPSEKLLMILSNVSDSIDDVGENIRDAETELGHAYIALEGEE